MHEVATELYTYYCSVNGGLSFLTARTIYNWLYDFISAQALEEDSFPGSLATRFIEGVWGYPFDQIFGHADEQGRQEIVDNSFELFETELINDIRLALEHLRLFHCFDAEDGYETWIETIAMRGELHLHSASRAGEPEIISTAKGGFTCAT